MSSVSELGPVYSPEGTQIAFTRTQDIHGFHGFDLWLMDGDGSDAKPLIVSPGRQEYSLSWQAA